MGGGGGGGGNEAVGGVSSRVGVSSDNTIMNRIMLRFRPIAPKPATGSGCSPAAEPRKGFAGSGRRKRRYVRACGTKKGNGRREKKSSGGVSRSDKNKVKTVRLLPDERGEEENSSMSPEKKERCLGPLDLKIAETGRPKMEAESWVTVLSVTDACMDWGGLGSTDEDKWMNLAEDTCPGFICDTDNHVVWSNAAYRRMVAGGGSGEEAAEVAVKLALSESLLLPVVSPAFACMVRVRYTWQQERAPGDLDRLRLRGGGGGERAMVVPCDVWRMNSGGYAWRLDVKAGLSLGWSCIN